MQDHAENLLEDFAKAVLREFRTNRPWFNPYDGEHVFANLYLEDMQGARLAAHDVLARDRRTLIIGQPGGGKSTLLNGWAIALAEAYLDTDPSSPDRVCAPLLISARQLRTYDLTAHTFMSTLSAYCHSALGVEIEPSGLSRLLEEGHLELLVDGLDELGGAWNKAVAEISDLFRRMPLLRGVISSRPAALTVRFANFTSYTIADLDRSQIGQIVAAATKEEPELTRQFTELLEQWPQVAVISRNPLLLHILVRLYREMGTVPVDRTALFSVMIELTLRRWSDKWGRGNAELRSMYDILAALAAWMFTQSKVAVSYSELVEVGSQALTDRKLSFETIEVGLLSTGFIEEREFGTFGFTHKGIAEYFVAFHYRDDPSKLVGLLSKEGGDEVWAFASGMVANPALLVEKAVARGELILAGRMVSSSRFDNSALRAYVAQAFRRALDPAFLELLKLPIAGSEPQPMSDAKELETAEADEPSPPTEADPVELRRDQPQDRELSGTPREPAASELLLDLLDGVRDESHPNEVRGKLFETFTAALFGEVFKVAYSNYLTDRGEIDLIIELEAGGLYWASFGNEALVECKNLRKKASYDQAATFITKVAQSRRQLGFIISYLGFTSDAERAIHDNAANRDAPLVIAISGDDIRRSLQQAEAPEEFFKNAYRNVTIPRRGRRRSKINGQDD